MIDVESATTLIERQLTKFMAEFDQEFDGLEIPTALAMIKVADLEIMIARGDYVGIEKKSGSAYRAISKGIAVLLPRLVQHAANCSPTTEKCVLVDHLLVRSYLGVMGDLIQAQRYVDIERYGLTRCRTIASDHIQIHHLVQDQESLEHADRNALLDAEHDQRDEIRKKIAAMVRSEHQAHVARGFPCSQTDLDAFAKLGRRYLEFYLNEYPEAEAFADESFVGPLKFKQWKEIMINICALGFAKSELEDAGLQLENLYYPEGFLMMRPSLITHEELRKCFDVTGATENLPDFQELAECIILSSDNATAEYGPDGALPCLVRLGEDVYITRYGRLGNPYMFLVMRLAKVYAFQMRRLTKEREEPFQKDLQRRLSDDNYIFGEPGVKIYGARNRPLTDIDSVIYEKATNCLYLIQLKWLAVHSANFELREKQHNELVEKGTSWLDKVESWVNRKATAEILQHVGIDNISIDIPTLKVRYLLLNRGWTRFSGKEAFDPRAAWISWSRLCWLMLCASDRTARLDHAWREALTNLARPTQTEPTPKIVHVAGLTVEIFN
ncbi:hypothetical protein [Massilia oculi]|uniref:hypothetical protein n=2 Tax=Pseudomonadota TaxID=1224 RepID=UPI001AAEC35B|nr:hypothetical protein [Massilia oculi]